MQGDIFRIREGMDVLGTKGEKVGTVGKVVFGGATRQPRFFTIEKGLLFQKDYLVPREAIVRVEGDKKAHISLTKDQVEKLPEYQGRPPTPEEVRKAYENLGGRRTESYQFGNVPLAGTTGAGGTQMPYYAPVEEYRILGPEEREREGYRNEWNYGNL